VNTESHRQTPPPAERPSRAFELGRGQLGLLAGFVLAIPAADWVLRLTPFGALVPEIHLQNQVQRFGWQQAQQREAVLILGSSRVQFGIEPKAVSTYLSAASETPRNARRWPFQALTAWTLERLVTRDIVKDPPKELLVIGLEERLFYRPQHEAQDTLGFGLLNSLADWASVPFGALDSTQLEGALLAPLRGLQLPFIVPVLYGQGLGPYVRLLEETQGQPAETFRPLSRGELAFALEVGREIRARPKPDPNADPLLPLEMAAFERTLTALASLPCRVQFVIMPVSPAYEAEESAGFQAFRQRVLPLVERAGIPVYDLNQHPELRQEGVFANPSHLNTVGAVSASRLLAHAVIAPRLGLSPPAGWREDYWLPIFPAAPGAADDTADAAAPSSPAADWDALTPEERGEREALFRQWLETQQTAEQPAPGGTEVPPDER
jgi:hypothetical protein